VERVARERVGQAIFGTPIGRPLTVEQIDALTDSVLAALPARPVEAQEVERLRRWKAEVLPVIAGLQGLGRALGVGLGERITGESAAEKARTLVAERDAALARAEAAEAAFAVERREGEALRAVVEAVRGLAAGWRADGPTDTEPGLVIFLDRLDAALSGQPVAQEGEEEAKAETRLAAALLLMLHDAHPTYGSTAGWHGGIGGQAITTGCNVIDPPPGGEWASYDLPSKPLREWLADHPEVDIRAEADALREELLRDLRGVPVETGGEGR
jgi:hypothetical protein